MSPVSSPVPELGTTVTLSSPAEAVSPFIMLGAVREGEAALRAVKFAGHALNRNVGHGAGAHTVQPVIISTWLAPSKSPCQVLSDVNRAMSFAFSKSLLQRESS